MEAYLRDAGAILGNIDEDIKDVQMMVAVAPDS